MVNRTTMSLTELRERCERLVLLCRLLDEHDESSPSTSYLLSLSLELTDYFRNTKTLTQLEAEKISIKALTAYRASWAIEALYERPIDDRIVNHTLFREVGRLFDKSQRKFETSEFCLFIAAYISQVSPERVSFLKESRKKDERSPDLQIGDLCYLECKDLGPATPERIPEGMESHIPHAITQLIAGHARRKLRSSGLAIDWPLRLFPEGEFEGSPFVREAIELSKHVLSQPGAIDFMVLSASGFAHSATHVSFPHSLVVLTRQGTSPSVLRNVVGRIATRFYVCSPDPDRERRIRERAYYRWLDQVGEHWRDARLNWLAAETDDLLDWRNGWITTGDKALTVVSFDVDNQSFSSE